MSFKIPVANTFLVGNEKRFVADCMESGWISSAGKYIELFEAAFAELCGTKHAITCCNGTAALHLSLIALGIQAGDEVIVPTLTFVATPNAVTYCGARPIFVDSEPEAWNLDSQQVEAKITDRTKAIIAVHLYGHPAEMSKLRKIADRHNLFLIEDAAEAHGAQYDGQIAGSLGDIAAFSFYANKIITTGEGGMVVTNNDELAARVRLYRGQGMDLNRRYWHPVIGYNYRMTNLSAAIGLAQIEKINLQLDLRRKIAELYRARLGEMPGIIWQSEQSSARHVYWMFSVVFDQKVWKSRELIMKILSRQGIETRPIFYPVHSLPPFIDAASREVFPVAEKLSANGLSLPTWSGLTEDKIDYVCHKLRQCMK